MQGCYNIFSFRNILGSFLLLLGVIILYGQQRLLTSREIDNKFSQVWKTSELTKRQYYWKARTEVTRDKKVVQVLTEEFFFGPDGRLIRKVLSDQQAPLPSTILIRQIAEEQKAKIVTFMADLRAFLEKYALADDSKRHAFFSSAKIGVPDTSGQLLVSGSDVYAKGDKLYWWIDTKTYSITKATISTIFEGTSAAFSGTYKYLPGFNYMSGANILVPSKNMAIKLQFYDFVKQ